MEQSLLASSCVELSNSDPGGGALHLGAPPPGRARSGVPITLGHRLCKQGCGSWLCATCGPGRGWKLAERLQRRFRRLGVQTVGLLTVTLAPRIAGAGPGEQVEFIRRTRMIGRLMRHVREVLGVESLPWCRVMEFHKRGGVHFHILIDGLGRLSKGDLAAIQAWAVSHVGTIDYKYVDGDAGARYVAKYVAKGTETDTGWLAEFTGRLTFVQASMGYWSAVEPPVWRPPARVGPPRQSQRLSVRLIECGRKGVVVLEQYCRDGDGEIRWKFRKALKASFNDIRAVVLDIVGDEDRERVQRARTCLDLTPEQWVEVATVLLARSRGERAGPEGHVEGDGEPGGVATLADWLGEGYVEGVGYLDE